MKCKNCGEAYNEEMFPVCPFCLTENADNEVHMEVKKDNQSYVDDIKMNTPEVVVDADVEIQKQEAGDKEKKELIPSQLFDIRIEDIKALSLRAKNILRRNGIFTLEALDEIVSKNKLSSIKGLGKETEKEIKDAITNTNGQLEIEETNTEIRIARVYSDNRFNLFVKYCNAHKLYYMSQLKGFDFGKLLDVYGIGKGKEEEIVKEYEEFCSKNGIEHEPQVIEVKRMFAFISSDLMDIDIIVFSRLGLSPKTINLLRSAGYTKVGDLLNISQNHLEMIVGKRNIEKFELIELDVKKSFFELFEHVLNTYSKEVSFDIVVKKASGYTLQRLADESNVTRERIRQKIAKFNREIAPFMREIVKLFISPKGYITLQEILDIYDNDDYDRVLVYWCKTSDDIEYLDFADVFVYSNNDGIPVSGRIQKIIEEYIGDGISIKDNIEDIELMMESCGYPYVDGESIINLAKKCGYKVFGNYLARRKKSYGYLCSKIVATRFPQGIKLYDGDELNHLREYAKEEYGDIGVSDDDRSLSARLSDYLVLSGKGMATAESNVHVEMAVLDQIKEYIDDSPERELYYSELFSRFEGMLRMMSNIDNYNFLHGVLKLYYSDEYDFANKDFLTKRGEGYKSGRLGDKVKRLIENNGRPISRIDIKKHILGLTDIALINAVQYDPSLFMWEYGYYYSLDLMDIQEEDINRLLFFIESIMKRTNGYCSDRLLFEEFNHNSKPFLEKNKIGNETNLYYVCQKLLSDRYDFRRPHIGRKGLFDEMSVITVALHMLGNPTVLSFRSYQNLANELRWSTTTVGAMFSEIEKDYIRISDDEYIKESDFEIDDSVKNRVEKILRSEMRDGFVSLINYDEWDEYPAIQYDWNIFLLRSIIDKYLKGLKVIETVSRDRRYERGVVIDASSRISNYSEMVRDFLRGKGYSEISENDMLTILVMNNLTYKMIPKELYTSEALEYKDEVFEIVQPFEDQVYG